MSRIKVQLLVWVFSMVLDFLWPTENETICVSQPLQQRNDEDRQSSRYCKKKYFTKKVVFVVMEPVFLNRGWGCCLEIAVVQEPSTVVGYSTVVG